MKIFRVTFYPESYDPNRYEVTDVTCVLNDVRYFGWSVEFPDGESPIRNPEWYSVQVKADDTEKAKEKGMKQIDKYRKQK